jgi:hypothetical protein
MKARMGAARALGLVAAAAMVTAGLGVVTPPAAHADDPFFPPAESPSWLPIKKGGAVLTDSAGEVNDAYLDLTATGGTFGPAGGYVSASLQYAYFRFHVAALPAAGAAGGFVVQLDTDGNKAGWEKALRYDIDAGTVTILSAGPNAKPTDKGTVTSTITLAANARATVAGVAGGAEVAFALTRAVLAAADINVASPMVLGVTNETLTAAGAALNANSLLGLGKAKADILGVGKSSPTWTSIASDPLAIDSDGDGVADNLDNCPIDVNADQADDDASLDGTLAADPALHIPDGTEGKGNVCDPTPRGYDSDGDDVGYLDDDCKERPGIQANGCPATDSTVAVLRYKARTKTFKGTVRGSQYDQCAPRRGVTVTRVTPGPDRIIGTVRTGSDGKYSLKVSKKPRSGKYYVYVDRRTNFDIGLVCTAVKSPKIQVG